MHEVALVYGQYLSCDWVHKVLHWAGYHALKRVKKPLLMQVHWQQYLQFMTYYMNWTVQDWGQVLWFNETELVFWILLQPSYVWKRPGDPKSPEDAILIFKHGGKSLMIWGCVSAQGVSQACCINKKMRADIYVQILDQCMIPSLRGDGEAGHQFFSCRIITLSIGLVQP
jgi:hypothetical protein